MHQPADLHPEGGTRKERKKPLGFRVLGFGFRVNPKSPNPNIYRVSI
jgi:hypothetical protein